MTMASRTVYIETSIVSYLTARPSHDLLTAACQQATRDWWEKLRSGYELFTSELVVAEARRGDPGAAEKRLDTLRSIPELRITDEAKGLAKTLVIGRAVPRKAEADALHIAVAAVHEIDLLITWNCRHIDNPVAKPGVRFVCEKAG